MYAGNSKEQNIIEDRLCVLYWRGWNVGLNIILHQIILHQFILHQIIPHQIIREVLTVWRAIWL